MSRGPTAQATQPPSSQPDTLRVPQPNPARVPWIALLFERVQGDRLMFGVAECTEEAPEDRLNILAAAAAREVTDWEGLASFTLYFARLLGTFQRVAEAQGFTAPPELPPAINALNAWACLRALEQQEASARPGDPASPE